MIKEIELHVSHFGNGTGAKGHIDEVTEARKVTKRVYEILQSMKIPSTYFEDTKSKNQRDNINTLVKHHNQDKDGLVVSIHFNAGGDGTKAIGTEVLYYNQKDLASRLSKAISDATGGGLKNRGAKQRKDLGVLASTYEPAILIEVCFVNSVIDVAIYKRDFEKICQAIARELAKEVVLTKVVAPAAVSETITNARKLIKQAISEGIFTGEHKDLNNYTTEQLLHYALIYIERTRK